MQIFSSQKFQLIFIFISIYNIHGLFAKTPADSWFLFARTANKVFDKCLGNHSESVSMLWSCFKWNSLILFDEVTSADVIPLLNTVQLFRDAESSRINSVLSSENKRNDDMKYKMLMKKYGKSDLNRTIWIDHILNRTMDILSSYKIRIHLNRNEMADIGEGRARHRFQVFPAMIFGMAVLGLITIPIGFHVMSIIGGKAFLFAVMALLIATMTSLKRLADFGSPYGVYPPHPHYHPPGYYERNGFE